MADRAHTGTAKEHGHATQADRCAIRGHEIYLAENPTATNADITVETDVPITESSVSRHLKKEGITRKKVSDVPVHYLNEASRPKSATIWLLWSRPRQDV